MRIVLVNQFYPPDVAPTGNMLQDLARTLIARGHQVQIVCSNRAYNDNATFPLSEIRDGVIRTTAFQRPYKYTAYCRAA
jgi:hypothetical protein